jgi:two-component system, OmpR family, alkaline phosphatase synthesis response regulator PhoP
MDHHLLAIEDRHSNERSVTELLLGWGYQVATASSNSDAIETGLAANPDLIIINHCEPRINAMQICAELRYRNLRSPVIVVAGREVQDRVAIFKAGADDYVLKPLDCEELQVRIQALLLRAYRRKKPDISSYEFGGMFVDFRESEVIRNGSKVELSQRENRLLRHFIENRGRVISRVALLRHVWGYREAPLTRTVDVHILRLRQKIEPDPKDPRFIVTVHGFGYRFDG